MNVRTNFNILLERSPAGGALGSERGRIKARSRWTSTFMTSPVTTSSAFAFPLGSGGFENDRDLSIMVDHVKTGKDDVALEQGARARCVLCDV